MIKASAPTTLTFQEYCLYEQEPGILYELFRGKLVPMSTPTGLHINICAFWVYLLQLYFAQNNLPWVAKTNTGVRTEEASSRIPDVVICSQSLWSQVYARGGAGILDFEEVPLLVVEVVSENWRQDYILKRAEYALVNILEYWIVDPIRERIWLLTNPASPDGYDRVEFKLGQEIESVQFPGLKVLVDLILNPPLVEELIKQEMVERQALQQQVQTAQERAEILAARLRELGENPDLL